MTARLAHGLVAAALTLASAGCAVVNLYRVVEPRTQTIAGVYTVEPRLAWSALGAGKVETWTIDGFSLGRLRFFTGLEEGQSMLDAGVAAGTAAVDERRPRFHPAMTLLEVTEFVADSLYGSRFPPRNLRPAGFGGAPGFRFEVSYATRDGVRREALVAGAVLGRRLHVIIYDGTSLYHFEKYRPEVERILDSIHLAAPARPTA